MEHSRHNPDFITLLWKQAWEWWTKGLCALIIFLAKLYGYHITPLQVTIIFLSIPTIILAYGIISLIRSNAVVKVVGRVKIVNGQPIIEWYGLKGRIPLIQTKTIEDILSKKANKNIFVCGTSGSGKTYAISTLLTRAFKKYPILALSFKSKDDTLKLPNFTVIDVSKTPINAFEDEDAFIRSFLISFPAEKVGIMYSGICSILRQALKTAKSWDDLIKNLEDLYNSTTDIIKKIHHRLDPN